VGLGPRASRENANTYTLSVLPTSGFVHDRDVLWDGAAATNRADVAQRFRLPPRRSTRWREEIHGLRSARMGRTAVLRGVVSHATTEGLVDRLSQPVWSTISRRRLRSDGADGSASQGPGDVEFARPHARRAVSTPTGSQAIAFGGPVPTERGIARGISEQTSYTSPTSNGEPSARWSGSFGITASASFVARNAPQLWGRVRLPARSSLPGFGNMPSRAKRRSSSRGVPDGWSRPDPRAARLPRGVRDQDLLSTRSSVRGLLATESRRGPPDLSRGLPTEDRAAAG